MRKGLIAKALLFCFFFLISCANINKTSDSFNHTESPVSEEISGSDESSNESASSMEDDLAGGESEDTNGEAENTGGESEGSNGEAENTDVESGEIGEEAENEDEIAQNNLIIIKYMPITLPQPLRMEKYLDFSPQSEERILWSSTCSYGRNINSRKIISELPQEEFYLESVYNPETGSLKLCVNSDKYYEVDYQKPYESSYDYDFSVKIEDIYIKGHFGSMSDDWNWILCSPYIETIKVPYLLKIKNWLSQWGELYADYENSHKLLSREKPGNDTEILRGEVVVTLNRNLSKVR